MSAPLRTFLVDVDEGPPLEGAKAATLALPVGAEAAKQALWRVAESVRRQATPEASPDLRLPRREPGYPRDNPPVYRLPLASLFALESHQQRALEDLLQPGTASGNGPRLRCLSGPIQSEATEVLHSYAQHRLDARSCVWWLRGSTPGALLADLSQLAEQLGPGGGVPLRAALERVEQWLATHDGWLLLIDDLSEDTVEAGLIPARGRGEIVVTTSTPSLLPDAEQIVIATPPTAASEVHEQLCAWYDTLCESTPEGAELVALLAVFGAMHFPFEVLHAHAQELPAGARTIAIQPLTLHEFLRSLQHMGTLRVWPDAIAMRSSVVEAARSRISPAETAKHREVALRLLLLAFPEHVSDPSCRKACQELLPAALAVVEVAAVAESHHAERSWLLERVGSYLAYEDMLDEAHFCLSEALELLGQLNDADPSRVAATTHKLARVQYDLGDKTDAMHNFEAALDWAKRAQTPLSVGMALSCVTLGELKHEVAERAEATACFRLATMMARQLLAEDREGAASVLLQLAEVFVRLGQPTRAARVARAALLAISDYDASRLSPMLERLQRLAPVASG